MPDKRCINATNDVVCNHVAADHDSGGCCNVLWCQCSTLVLIPDFDPLYPAISKIP